MKIINISGEIGWNVTPKDIKDQLVESAGADIDIHIASPGGFVFDGIEIYNAIRDYKRDFPNAQIMATIKGLAASMASYIAMNPAIDMLTAEDNAVFMIHNVWGFASGDYRDMEKSAEIFKGLTDLLGQSYSNKTGKSKKEIKELMDSGSWYFGNEIKDVGFVDEIIKTEENIDKTSAVLDGKVKMKALSEKLKEKEFEYEKIAAVLNSTHPASNAGKNILEVTPMTLNELMATNPAAKIELDKMVNEAKEAGKKEVLDISAKAAVFANGKDYPEQIKNVALDVMQGKKSLESLETLAANADMITEMLKSNAAKGETDSNGDHGKDQPPVASEDGTIKNSLDFQNEIKRSKEMLGLEV